MKTECDTCEFMQEIDRVRDRVKCEPDMEWHFTALYDCVLRKRAECKREKEKKIGLAAFIQLHS